MMLLLMLLLLLLLLVAPVGCRFDRSGRNPADLPGERDMQPRDGAVDLPVDQRGDLPSTDVLADLSTDLAAPDQGGCAPSCSTVTPICCDKGSGFGCYAISTTNDCRCAMASQAPCAGTLYAVCCDMGRGPRCYVSQFSLVDGRCACDSTTGQPCGGGYPVCCDKGQGFRCYAVWETDGCRCSSATGQPCSGTSYPLCCKKGPSWSCAFSC